MISSEDSSQFLMAMRSVLNELQVGSGRFSTSGTKKRNAAASYYQYNTRESQNIVGELQVTLKKTYS